MQKGKVKGANVCLLGQISEAKGNLIARRSMQLISANTSH